MGTKIMLRMATLQDIGCLGELYGEFHNFHARGVPDRLVSILEKPDIHEGTELYQAFERIIQSEDSAIFIAEVDQLPVGLAEIYIRQDEANPLTVPYRYGYLQSLMVSQEHRRQGIGTRLMRAIERWVEEKGASEIRLETWEFPQGPLPFYEKMGYQTLKRIMVFKYPE